MVISLYIESYGRNSFSSVGMIITNGVVLVYDINRGITTNPLNKTNEAKPPVPKLIREK